MKFPHENGLPLWLFILVILLSAASFALVIFVVWLKCSRRSRGLTPLLPSSSMRLAPKISVRRGQIVRGSWSLTGSEFGSGASREQSRHVSYQWPEIAYSGGPCEDVQKRGYHHPCREVAYVEYGPAGITRGPLSDVSRRQTSRGWRRSGGHAADEESLRPFYNFGLLGRWHRPDRAHPKPKQPKSTPLWLDPPAPLSPITPLTLPRTPQHQLLSPTNLDLVSKYAAVPPLPAKAADCVTQYRKELRSVGSTKGGASTRLDMRSLTSHCDPHDYRSSTVTNHSFLQTWSKAYRGWLAQPETLEKPDLPTSSHADVIPVTERGPESLNEHEMDVSLPSLTPILSRESTSPVSRTNSCGGSFNYSEREDPDRTFGESRRIRQAEMTWLVDH